MLHDKPPQGFVMGGALLRRPLTSNGARLPAGTVLNPEQFAAITYATRRVLVRDEAILPFYQPASAAGSERFVIHRGNGRYDVVVGTRLNADPLTREEADTLAASASH
jgi:hypothetical protein